MVDQLRVAYGANRCGQEGEGEAKTVGDVASGTSLYGDFIDVLRKRDIKLNSLHAEVIAKVKDLQDKPLLHCG